jgi:hypothetical protein
LNWRKLNLQTAVKTINQMLDCQSTKAFVLDDSIKIRHGKKMPGVSSHFDHTLGRRRVSFGNIGWWYKQYYTI